MLFHPNYTKIETNRPPINGCISSAWRLLYQAVQVEVEAVVHFRHPRGDRSAAPKGQARMVGGFNPSEKYESQLG